MRLHPGLYAITDTTLLGSRLIEGVAAAIAGGATVVQYRDKGDDPYRRRREAKALSDLCSTRGVPLIVNDDVALAAAVGAAGVHLGRDDGAIAEARQRLGPEALIGVSCYNEPGRAEAAAAAGADYLAFGACYPSSVKPDAMRATPELFTATRRLGLPLVAIGGITPENGPPLVVAGADLLAVISAVFGADDIEAAARRFVQIFEPNN